MYGLFFFLCIFLKIRDPSLHLLSSDIEADNEGCGCGKDEQQSFKKISHRDLPLNYYMKHEKMSTQMKINGVRPCQGRCPMAGLSFES